MILAATPNPGIEGEAPIKTGLLFSFVAPEASGFVVSVREGGGAMAAPPEVAVEKQSQLVGVFDTNFLRF